MLQGVVDLICRGTTALHVAGRYRSVEVGFSKRFSVVRGALLFAILYQELQDYCAQGAVKSLPTPRATETTGVRLSYQRNTHAGRRPSWITRRRRTHNHSLTHTHTQSKELGPVLFRLLNTNLTCHQSNLCQQRSPPPVPSTGTTKTAIRVDSSQENTYLTHCRNLP